MRLPRLVRGKKLEQTHSKYRGKPCKYRDMGEFTRFWQGPCNGCGAMSNLTTFDPSVKFVRVVETRTDGLVEFEFAIGEPELFVELLMPRAQFEEFCATQGVTPTFGRLAAASAGSAEHEWDWSLHAAREQRFRHEP